MFGMYGQKNTFNLQATLSAASASSQFSVAPHHPITCRGELRYEEDNTFGCEHVSVPHDDERTKYCVDHSLAILLMELAREKLG